MSRRDPTRAAERTAEGRQADAAVVLAPRRFLVGLAVVVLVPWVALASLYLRGWGEAPAGGPPAASKAPARGVAQKSEPMRGAVGPWGQIETTPIVISPPLEYIPDDPDPPRGQATWFFALRSLDELAGLLESVGLDRTAEQKILAAPHEPRRDGLVVHPDADLVRALDPEARRLVYSLLAESPQNDRQFAAFRFFGSTVDEWLGSAPVSRETLERVRPLVYERDGFLFFADVDIVRPHLSGAEEFRRLVKGLARESTLLVAVRVPDAASLDSVAEYWGRGGRRTDLRPLLESVSAGNRTIDVTLLLPAFARGLVYRYPRVTLADLKAPELDNCFWTAMNFFADSPDDAFRRLDRVTSALERDYYLVHDDLQLGDLVMLASEDGIYYHAAVYIADGLVFGKNGRSPLSPWTIVPLERLEGYYPRHAGDRVEYFRRKGL